MGKNKHKHAEQQRQKSQEVQRTEICPICKGLRCDYCNYTGEVKIITAYQQDDQKRRR